MLLLRWKRFRGRRVEMFMAWRFLWSGWLFTSLRRGRRCSLDWFFIIFTRMFFLLVSFVDFMSLLVWMLFNMFSTFCHCFGNCFSWRWWRWWSNTFFFSWFFVFYLFMLYIFLKKLSWFLYFFRIIIVFFICFYWVLIMFFE